MADRNEPETDASGHDDEGEERGDRPTGTDGDAPDKPGLLTRYPVIRYALIAALVAGIVAAAMWYVNYRERGQYRQSTNNAYVRADFVTVSPKLGGYVERVLVRDNQPVRRGQLLAVLDPRDYRASVAQAQAQVASAVAGIRTARSTLDEQRAAIAQSAAQVSAAEVAAEAAAAEVRRYEPLAQSGAESRERLAALVVDRDRAVANLRTQRATYLAARRGLETQSARIGQALAQRETAQAQLDRASTDLGAVELRSSIDGVVADKAVRVGQFVQPATRLMSIVPANQLYIEANFKETQVALMRVGQPATIKVDALDGAELRGRIDSFAPGTGAQFSVLPPENATGNFTKIVQRVPVRISIEAGPEARKVLRPGLSVEVTIDTIGAKGSRKRIEEESERLGRDEAQVQRR
ncbi:HlyD family secretion protein [Novosphingobium panipatense]|uniref:Membrane fusion protein, multidrug efflux system n=1 Tax=Novosphingobium panipatense TaxID=428991 RepID=A0ABY1QYE0_9SPHN|nr:HlyD family secretion protein [Novosphingobium panipatense]SMP81301.1 membrane fusion protein, multidrug efflux system [Novosphingobium panipatense]